MRGSVYRRCFCRDPQTGRPFGKRCPKLGKVKGHGAWFFRYDAPRGPDGKRRQPEVGPFATQKAAEEEQAATLARLGGGGQVHDRALTVGAYLMVYAESKIDVKASTQAAIREAVRLYWAPALGHLRLVDLRDFHIAEAIREMQKINRPLPGGERPSETLRRLLAARADDERRDLPAGEERHLKSPKPLSPTRIKRVFAVLSAAMNAAVPQKLAASPCQGVALPRAHKVKPLPWTAERESAWRGRLAKRMEKAPDAGSVTTVERQRLWATTPRPSPVMVWLPAHTGAFLDAIETERLYALFCLVAYCGLRRGEVLGLTWAEVNLGQGVVHVRETGDGDDPKSESGVRAVPLPAPVVAAMRAWRRRQTEERLAWGPDWTDTGRVFTREDGADLTGQWVSVRFETLAYRRPPAGPLP